MLRVQHVSPSFFPAQRYGGPVTSLHALVRAQAAAGHCVRVLSSVAGHGDLPATQRPRPDTWMPLGEVDGTRSSDALQVFYGSVVLGDDVSLTLAKQVWTAMAWADVLHVTGLWSPSSLWAIACAVSRRCPVVVSPRGALLPWALRQGRQKKQVVLRSLRPLLLRVAGWHVTSQEEADSLRTLGIIGCHATVGLLPNGATLEKPAEPASDAERLDAWCQPGSGPWLLMLGRVHPVKQVELGLAALAALRAQHPTAQLIVAGPLSSPSAYVEALQTQASALGLSQAVHFIGPVAGSAKQRLLKQAAALWLLSHMESFGNVVLEALAQGTAVVATHNTPWSALSQAGIGAWVAADAKAIAAATSTLIEASFATEESVQRAQADARRAFVAEHYAWDVVERKMTAFYREVRGKASGAA